MELPHIIIFIICFWLGRCIVITLHELGHGICAVLFTKKPVTLFLGSYGNKEKKYRLKVGLFTIYIEYNPLRWRGGLCKPSSTDMNIFQHTVSILAGPLLPLITAIVFYIVAENYLHPYYHVAAIFLLIFTALLAFTNLVPSKKLIQLSNGNITHNDGYHLLTLFKYRTIYKEYRQAINLYLAKEYQQAIPYLDYLLQNGMNDDENIQGITISAKLLVKDYEGAKQIINTFTSKFDLTPADLINFGYYYSQTGDHAKALEYYHKSLLKKETWMGYNNSGYSLNALERYPEAIEYFDKAIKMAPKHAFPYNNRELAKIKLGNSEDGLKDLEHSFSLDPENSYYYKSMGIYHFDRGEFEPALKMFETARQKDATTYKIDEHIKETKLLLA